VWEGEIETVQTDDLPFRYLAQALPTPCWISDAEGEIVWVNDAWVNYTGLTVEAIREVGLAVHGLEPGDYSVVEVIDTGQGMAPEVRAHAFEPFFTTKGVGKGVGLGLAQVYGVARRGGGTATVESEVGVGAIVRLYLRCALLSVHDEPRAEPWAATGERVLLVEDDPLVAVVTESMLADLGWRSRPYEARGSTSSSPTSGCRAA
jgi:hypothetical protein